MQTQICMITQFIKLIEYQYKFGFTSGRCDREANILVDFEILIIFKTYQLCLPMDCLFSVTFQSFPLFLESSSIGLSHTVTFKF
jgi:hypothetical protein